MSESKDEVKDESSIKPVSSLRSRFENLNAGNTAASTSPTPPSPALPSKPAFLRELQPTLLRKKSADEGTYGTGADAGAGIRGGQDELILRKRGPVSPRSRPHSMIAMSPTQLSGPTVRINPPNSPAKYGANSPAAAHARTLSRAETPIAEARPPPFLGPLNGHRASSDGAVTVATSPDIRPKSPSSNVPPAIDRAGKPSIPKKPLALAQKPATLSAPRDISGNASERSVSPFNTPPSSGGSSPAPSKPYIPPRLREDSDPILGGRARGESDASFVEQLRSDSNDTSPDRARAQVGQAIASSRVRAQSNTSYVEPSSLPEMQYHWNVPPSTHHHAATRREQLAHGKHLPSRCRTMTASEVEFSDSPEQRPRLPARPELQSRSVRNSPTRRPTGRTSPGNGLGLSRSMTFDGPTPQRIPASKHIQRSALTLGFGNDPSTRPRESSMSRDVPVSRSPPAMQLPPRTHASTLPASKPSPPSVPAPRRSMDRRREIAPPISGTTDGHSRDDEEDPSRFEKANGAPGPTSGSPPAALTDFPDSSQASRRPPRYRQRPHHIYTESEARTFAVCGQYVCTTGHTTKAWNLRTGEQLLNMAHNETVRVSALVFKPSTKVEDEGKRIWLGTNSGEIHEIDIPSQSLVKTKVNAHPRREIIRMYRHASELWTLDDGGDLNVWKPDCGGGSLSLDSQCNSFRVPRGHTFSIALGSKLWYATGKDIRVFAPGARSDTDFQILRAPLSQQSASEVCSGATLSGKPDLVYFGHSDGKVSIYNCHDYSCVGVVNVSMYKLASLVGVGDYLWAGFHTGMVFVYDTSSTPWRVKKDWKAHDKYVWGIAVDRSSVWKFDRLQVVTLGVDNLLKIWDGTLEEDWLDSRMKDHDTQYCSFRELTASVFTWNAGATKPHYLQQDLDAQALLQEYITTREYPDIFVFGLQELIDLENKKVSAKSFFKSITKDPNEPEHIGHQYRAWRDYFTRCLDEYMPANQTYTLLHTSSLVGLFTCIFVKTPLRARIRHVHAAEVKRGMGGHHGNKGALILRLVLDDSSICFINCHLAAGQTQTKDRNHDIAEILEAGNLLPTDPLDGNSTAQHSDVFASGGDGSMILDHEICILSGDLNYRIDTMGRDTIIKLVSKNQFPRLLERDQLLLSRKKNAGNRLRAFQESEIRFAPTYKYDPRSDRYDSSEKRRAPAWCDRILYRGLGKVKMEEYRRWEIRVSDHRPVSGLLRLRVKSVDREKRAQVWEVVKGEFETVRQRICREVQIEYLTLVLGLSAKEAAAALKV